MSGNWHKQGNIRGKDGVGVPTGGQAGQSLQKVGNSDFATAWAFPEYKDIVGKVPKAALPDIGNSTVPVESEAAMLNLPAVPGNQAIRTDLGTTFVLMELPASDIDNWLELVTTSDVQSVNGQTGNVNLTKADVGLSKVNNTADSDKPLATQSVPGLLSPGDKEKLDEARDSTGPNSLVYRNSGGNAGFNRVYLSEAPDANNAATSKSYVDDGLAGRVKILGVLGSGVNLNDLDYDCVGVQHQTANASTALNYPIASAGAIQVITQGASGTGEMVYQFYTQYHPSQTTKYWRTHYSTHGWGDWKRLVDTEMLADSVAEGVKPAEFQLNELQGGQVLTKTIPDGVGWASGHMSDDWDSRRAFAQTGVVEGFVKGCPVGGAVTGTESAGFVKDPVWKLEVRPEGLGYVTQRAQLLSCVPVYMVGFAWERIYNPAEAKWGAWTCVAGDTGELNSTASTATTNIEAPFRHKDTSTVKLFWTTPLRLRRTGNSVAVVGDMSPANTTGLNQLHSNSQSEGLSIAYFDHSEDSGVLGCESIFIPRVRRALGCIQQGSGKNTWYMAWLSGTETANAFVACRYGTESQASVSTWLAFNFNYTAPPVNTYTGPGFVPPVLDAETGTPEE